MTATTKEPSQIPECDEDVLAALDTEVEASTPHALCNDGAGTLVGLFFSEDLNDIASAKSICRRCPLNADCLQGALERQEPWGVWGGELFQSGKILAFKRKRGRPPKNPRPEELAAASGIPLPTAGA